MLFGLTGVELSLIIVCFCLFGGILSGYPVAFAISGSAVMSFFIIAVLNEAGMLYTLVDGERIPVFEGGWDRAMLSTLSTWSQGVFSRAFGGNVETLLAVPLFVLMGIALERSNIAEDLLTTMAKMFGSLPGGLAIAVVVVGTLLAASTGIVGATVVTMGLISLPTMLRYGYSKSLATGVIATSGTLGQIIPPSIVIVLLGSIVGDMYALGQESRAKELGVTVLEMLGEPAVLSTGTLFKAAFIPGIFLALLYGLYALGFAFLKPEQAPPVDFGEPDEYQLLSRYNNNIWALVAAIFGPIIVLSGLWVILSNTGLAGTSVVAEGDREVLVHAAISHGAMAIVVLSGFLICLAGALRPSYDARPILIGLAGVVLIFLVDAFLVPGGATGGETFLYQFIPLALTAYGLKMAIPRLSEVDAIRVVSPPVILIIAVLGSILGGITNPTAAAALGSAGAIMLAAARRCKDANQSSRFIIWSGLAIVVLLLLRGNFDLRMTIETITFENRVAIYAGVIAYHIAFFGLFYSCWVLIRDKLMSAIVYETTKVTSMVFVILIGSLFLSLTVRSFGGEHYIQEILRSFEDPRVLLIVVMVVLFLLGFVLDFIEIIFIVIPIVGPVIYAADPNLMPPEWITILIAVNLQTSFITPPFGFALFYLRGVAPPEVTTLDIYKGVVPFVIIQVIGLILLWNFPIITTLLPDLLPQN